MNLEVIAISSIFLPIYDLGYFFIDLVLNFSQHWFIVCSVQPCTFVQYNDKYFVLFYDITVDFGILNLYPAALLDSLFVVVVTVFLLF